MRFINIGTFAIVATLGLGTANAQTLYTCGERPVLNVQMITEMVAREAPACLATFASASAQV